MMVLAISVKYTVFRDVLHDFKFYIDTDNVNIISGLNVRQTIEYSD